MQLSLANTFCETLIMYACYLFSSENSKNLVGVSDTFPRYEKF